MASTLILPDGVRLARRYELPLSGEARASAWARVVVANITAGFTITESSDPRFSFYAEANVDGPQIWVVFRELCRTLLGPQTTLVLSEIDDEPSPVGSANVLAILNMLEPHRYQLINDGYLQFGLVDNRTDLVSEVFVNPTKHFSVWLNDEELFRSILQDFGIPEAEELEFLDEYPHTTTRLPDDRVSFRDLTQLVEHFNEEIKEL